MATKSKSPQRGQSLVEFSLLLPILLFVLMLLIDGGWALRDQITVTNAVREGARYGVTGVSSADIKARTVARSSGLLSTADIKVCRGTACDSSLTNSDASTVIVGASYSYRFVTPLGGLAKLLTGGAITDLLPLTASTSMRLE
jgi:Flp pilus assembly protein TadG